MIRFRNVALVGLVALALSGCSVGIVGETGLTVEDGRVIGLVRICDDYTATELHLTPREGQFFLIPHPTWVFEATSDARIDLGSIEEFLGLIGGREMRLNATNSGGSAGVARFDDEAVLDLEEGEVITRGDRGADVVLSDSEFEIRFAETCSYY
jgi:hypothetical protein